MNLKKIFVKKNSISKIRFLLKKLSKEFLKKFLKEFLDKTPEGISSEMVKKKYEEIHARMLLQSMKEFPKESLDEFPKNPCTSLKIDILRNF